MCIDIYNETPVITISVSEGKTDSRQEHYNHLKTIFDLDLALNQMPIRAVFFTSQYIDPRWAFVFDDNTHIAQSAYLKPQSLMNSIIEKKSAGAIQLDPEFTYFIGYNHDYANYYHWTVQCLPALSLYFALKNFYPRLKLLLPSNLPGFALQYLKHLEIDNAEVEFLSLGDKLYKAEKLIYPSFIGGEYSFNTSQSVLNFAQVCFEKGIGNGIKKDKKKQVVYCARLDSKNRKINNEQELIRLLEKKFGADIFTSANLDVKSQIRKFYEADVLISPHGAGLSNILYCRKGSKIIELIPDKYKNPCFATLAVNKECDYYPLIFPTISADGHQHEYQWEIDLDAIERLLTQII